MAEAQTTDVPIAAQSKSEAVKTPEKMSMRMQKEVKQVSSALFRSKTNQEPTKIDADPAAKKLFSSEYFGNLTKEQIGNGIDFPSGEDTENAIKGEPVYLTVAGEKGRLVRVIDCGEDTLKCQYQSGEGDAAILKTADVPRRQVFEANLIAERKAIEEGFTGDEKAVVKTYLDMIDPSVADKPEENDDSRKTLETVAEKRGMITTAAIQEAVQNVYKGEIPDDAKQFLADLTAKGTIVLDRQDFQDAMGILGLDRNALGQQSDTLLDQLSQEQARLEQYKATGADTDLVQRKIDEIKGQLILINNADKLLGEAEAKGVSPLEDYFEKAQNGELNPEKAEAFLKSIKSGDLSSVLATIPELQITDDMSDAEKEEKRRITAALKSGSLKGLKWGGILLAILAALPVAVGGAAAVVATGAVSQGMTSQR